MSRMAISAAALAAAAVLPVSAYAASYAVSINQIDNFSMWVTGGSISPFTFTFSNDAAALDTVGASNVNALDATGACVGSACSGWQNQFSSHSSVTTAFSYGDARILSLPTLSGGLGTASAIGETHTQTGTGYGTGGNTMIAIYGRTGSESVGGYSRDLLP